MILPSRWLPKHPEDEAVVKNRKFYEIELNFPREVREEVRTTPALPHHTRTHCHCHWCVKVVKVIAEPGMYFEMKPLPGAIEGINDMLSKGLDVFIVTAPHPTCYPSCAAEKYQVSSRLHTAEKGGSIHHHGMGYSPHHPFLFRAFASVSGYKST